MLFHEFYLLDTDLGILACILISILLQTEKRSSKSLSICIRVWYVEDEIFKPLNPSLYAFF